MAGKVPEKIAMGVNMQVSALISEEDQQLVHALQVSPRISWTRLAPILGVDAGTLARRWQRIADAGIARVIAHNSMPLSNDNVLTHVQLACALKKAPIIAETLARDTNVFTVHLSSGDYPVTLIVASSNLEHFTTYLTERIGTVPGVRSARTHPQTALHIDGSSWELDALSKQQRALIAATRAKSAPPTTSSSPDLDYRIYDILLADGRTSYADIARRLELSLSTARRRVDSLISTRKLSLRCDVARHPFGWPVAAYLFGSFPNTLSSYVPHLRREIPEIRVLASSASANSQHFYLWLRNLTDLPLVEQRIMNTVPGLVFGERYVLLRTVKQVGHIQDTLGRTTEIIPTKL
ncbi:AsnC family transcriptional regulator [Arthrobacter sp. B1805]|uniref:AsnC family transcriptional regulator n=1 Tax=Arthrobacter sp. B1805 TaxID=2058892 RepID=UPI000CE53C12|nr:AsnC family transcriptional regulator [Arthrobacter sp. B1805]